MKPDERWQDVRDATLREAIFKATKLPATPAPAVSPKATTFRVGAFEGSETDGHEAPRDVRGGAGLSTDLHAPDSLLDQVCRFILAGETAAAAVALRFALKCSATQAGAAVHLIARMAATPARPWAPHIVKGSGLESGGS